MDGGCWDESGHQGTDVNVPGFEGVVFVSQTLDDRFLYELYVENCTVGVISYKCIFLFSLCRSETQEVTPVSHFLATIKGPFVMQSFLLSIITKKL